MIVANHSFFNPFDLANQALVTQLQTPDVPSILKQRKPSTNEGELDGRETGDQMPYCPSATLVGEEEEDEEGDIGQSSKVGIG